MTIGELIYKLKRFPYARKVKIQTWDMENAGQHVGDILFIKIDCKDDTILLSDND